MDGNAVIKVSTSKEANETNENLFETFEHLQIEVIADSDIPKVNIENQMLDNLHNDSHNEYCYDSQEHTMQLDASNNNIIYCSTCGEVIHIVKVTNEMKQEEHEQFQCNECGKFFMSEISLNQHIHYHKLKKIFQCGECEKFFTSSRVLDKHIIFDHSEAQIQFACNVCGMTFESLPQLKIHKSVHMDKQYMCLVCEKTFSVSTSLKQHILIHTGERKYQCSLCNKKFISKCNLNLHLLIHTNYKAFQCFKCGMTFKHKGQLKRHIMTHTGEKTFFCDQCGKAFADYRNMIRHQTTHLKEKPFECSICNNRFTYSKNLKRHIQMLHQKTGVVLSATK